jgi:cytochrome c oxidase subunit III
MMSAKKSDMETPAQVLSMHPRKFLLWLFIVSIVMIFASLTSAYVVKQSEGAWLIFDLPQAFVYSSIVVLLSSATMQWAYWAAKKDNLSQIKIAVGATLALSLVFLIVQYLGWGQLVDQQVFFVGNPAGSFIYVLTGLHAFHLAAGIVFLIIVLISTLRFKVHSKSMTQIEMCTTFWHFLSGLWIYLYLFLLLNN